ncbi:amidohydrolase [Clostridioides difficile]|uniref:amidohydrolase n=1 Tax=Clostridioides difficile TaxID=1496 RepID=UPI001C173356|nr:amidohydrolase [Clostridioides difficile]MDF3816992.1 amidohydrolase [Clostridioides difficile]HBF4284415.1 amidohydrolase [Clostridioides difficile]HBF5049627.1 amidohydrolase [Clostridioides difficile]HBF5113168.1 amidohydrolase [Clostridioides difficile]HBF5877881.1 amidohydrolase [Clostridioides difficile]
MIFIKNGKINTITNGIIHGDILIDEGKIIEIGEDLIAPLDVEVIDASNKLVFPGFIDAHTHLGLWEDGIGFEGADGNEETDPITPQLNPIDGINPMDRTFKEAFEGGITSVCTTPGSANVMGGQCIAIKTCGKRIDKMVIKNPVASKIAFGENPKSCYGQDDKSPQTRMAIAALLRENLKKAEEYLEDIDMYESHDDEDCEKPEYDIKMESLIPVLRREIPFKAHAHRADDMFTAIRIAKEFNLKLTLDHCTEGHLIVDELVEEGFPVIVGPSLSERSKFELRNLTFNTAGILSNAGLDVCIMTDHPVIPVQYLPICAGIAVKYGMKEEKAIESITINPAKTLGIEDRVGSIEVGKDADLVIWDNSPLEIQSNVLYTIINGKVVYEKK